MLRLAAELTGSKYNGGSVDMPPEADSATLLTGTDGITGTICERDPPMYSYLPTYLPSMPFEKGFMSDRPLRRGPSMTELETVPPTLRISTSPGSPAQVATAGR
jgi:hypothetical protein